MKILIVTGLYPPEIGGPATYSQTLFNVLPRHNIDVDVLTFSAVRKYPKVLRHLLFVFKILSKGKNVDLYYAQDPVSVGLPTCVASLISRKKYILKVVGDYAWEQGTQRYGVIDLLDYFSAKNDGYSWMVKILKIIQKFVAQRSLAIIVPSNYLKKIVTNWGVSAEKISVIYNSFDPILINEDRNTVRQELGLADPTVVSVGRLVPWKGFSTLIEIFPEIQKNIPDLCLIIIGSGPDELSLRKLATEKGAKNIKIVGGLDQKTLFRYLYASDVFVLNTSYEGFSHQLLEVMSIGTPIITTSVGGNPELIDDNQTGILVKYDDREKIKEAILRVLSDESLSARLSAAGKNKVSSFSKDRMILNFLSFLKTLKV